MLLPDETYDHGALAAGHLLSMLRVYDDFLLKYRIRPEFFCRYKEKEALQKRLSKVVEETNKRNAQSTQDASSSNEAVHLQQRLRSLSSELVTLRNRLHVQGSPPAVATTATAALTAATAVTPCPISTTPTASASTLSNPTLTNAQITNNTSHNTNGQHLSKTGGVCSPTIQPNANVAVGMEGGKFVTISTASDVQPTSASNNGVVTGSAANGIGQADILPLERGIKYGSGVDLCMNKIGGGGSKGLTFSLSQQQQQLQQVGMSALQPPCSIKNIANMNGGLLPPSTIIPTCADGNSTPTHLLPPMDSLCSGGGALYQRIPLACTALDDLIHMAGPLTEDAVMRCLHGRFSSGQYYTNVGPILLCVNPYKDVGNPLTLSSTRGLVLSKQLNKIVKEAVRQQSETGYPQAIILSGTSGSGKSHASMLLLRQLFAVAGGGPETDAFKHLAAAFTVLRSLGSAKTSTNSESSRIGQFIEVQVTDGALYRTKIHCYFLDQTRVIHPLPGEKNYHIFYQMLAGLSTEERAKLNLEGCTPTTLKYLQHGDIRQDIPEDSTRFQAWKTCLGILGIPFLDVVRVLAAVLLLGNIQFVDGKSLKVDVKGETELNAVAALLGVSGSALFRGLTSRTHNARGQLVKSVCDANMSNMTRDCLAKALYCRTVATIVRRANSLKRLGSTLGTLSSDSNESVHNHQAEVASQHASTVGGTTNAGSKSMAALNNAVRHATDGFIGILDMFGFEDPKPSQLEHLCINLCAETMQHFYNTHIFKSSIESCRDEGINCEVEVDYVDNVPCIDLISSLRTGLLSMLDVECSIRGTAESYVAKIRVQHKHNTRLFDPKPLEQRLFGIQHFSGRVVYDASDFLDTNKDVVPDDLVGVFYKHSCNFGFATHLFGSELKALYSVQDVPRGVSFRISPTSHTDLLNGDEPVSTLTQDFHTRLDNLLRTLVHARPHFVRCIRSNSQEASNKFDRGIVVRQIRSLQILETVNLMAGGYPHRMRFKAFNARYRLLAPFARLQRKEESVTDDCHLILQHVVDAIAKDFVASTSWSLGKRHIFLSEGIRQHLEQLRNDTRQRSATLIQTTWRGWKCRFRWANMRKEKSTASSATVKASSGAINRNSSGTRPRPQPIAGTPPPDPNEKCDSKIIQQTCNLFGLDLERPPPVPPSRSYTVTGNTKLSYPQTRLMKMSFPEDGSGEAPVLVKGESVLVVGASHRRGHLIVEHKQCTLHVPFQFLELKSGVNI